MVIVLDVEVMNLRQGWFSQVDLGPVIPVLRSRSLGFSPLTENESATARLSAQSKNREKSLFFRSLTDVQVVINRRSAR